MSAKSLKIINARIGNGREKSLASIIRTNGRIPDLDIEPAMSLSSASNHDSFPDYADSPRIHLFRGTVASLVGSDAIAQSWLTCFRDLFLLPPRCFSSHGGVLLNPPPGGSMAISSKSICSCHLLRAWCSFHTLRLSDLR